MTLFHISLGQPRLRQEHTAGATFCQKVLSWPLSGGDTTHKSSCWWSLDIALVTKIPEMVCLEGMAPVSFGKCCMPSGRRSVKSTTSILAASPPKSMLCTRSLHLRCACLQTALEGGLQRFVESRFATFFRRIQSEGDMAWCARHQNHQYQAPVAALSILPPAAFFMVPIRTSQALALGRGSLKGLRWRSLWHGRAACSIARGNCMQIVVCWKEPGLSCCSVAKPCWRKQLGILGTLCKICQMKRCGQASKMLSSKYVPQVPQGFRCPQHRLDMACVPTNTWSQKAPWRTVRFSECKASDSDRPCFAHQNFTCTHSAQCTSFLSPAIGMPCMILSSNAWRTPVPHNVRVSIWSVPWFCELKWAIPNGAVLIHGTFADLNSMASTAMPKTPKLFCSLKLHNQ